MMARLHRALLIALLCVGAPALAAATVAHAMLDDTAWTEADPQPTRRTVPPVPEPSASPSQHPAGSGKSGLLGTCATPTATGAVPTACSAPGALRVVGTVRLDAVTDPDSPCKGVPFTDTARMHRGYWLCLGIG